MYVRRKCYSILEDIDGEEKLFSVNEIEDVNDIEDIYDEERYFSDDERGGMSTAAKVGLGTAAGLGSLAGLTYAAKKGKLGSKAKGLYDQAAKKGKDIFESIKGKFGKKEVAEAQEKKGLGTGAKAGIGLAAIAAAVGLSKTKFVQALKGKLGAKAKAMAENAITPEFYRKGSKFVNKVDQMLAPLKARVSETIEKARGTVRHLSDKAWAENIRRVAAENAEKAAASSASAAL